MARPTTRLQVSGHRFLVRRTEHALVLGDTRMHDDPLRAQSISLQIGAVLVAVIIAVCAALAYLKPAGALGDAPVVVVRETGAMYVRVGDRLHPVFNLASARLVAGTPAEPRIVGRRAVERAERGPLVGIPGAPEQIPARLPATQWTVCDDPGSVTTVLVGPLRAGVVTAGHNLLVTPRGGSAATTYLIYGGQRSLVDLRHPAVIRALRLDGVAAQPVSSALLAAIPEAPPIVAPHIPAAGTAGPAGLPVGAVVRVSRADGADLFVVLADGVQRVGEVAADLIRYTDARAGRPIQSVGADRVGSLPVVDSLPVTTFPERAGVTGDPVACARWDAGTTPHTVVLTGAALPAVHAPVTLAQADGDGPALDAVSLPDGHGAFVRSVGLTAAGGRSASSFLVTERGVRFGVADLEAAAALGLTDPAAPAPWPVLAALPAGPELRRDAASIATDGLGGPS